MADIDPNVMSNIVAGNKNTSSIRAIHKDSEFGMLKFRKSKTEKSTHAIKPKQDSAHCFLWLRGWTPTIIWVCRYFVAFTDSFSSTTRIRRVRNVMYRHIKTRLYAISCLKTVSCLSFVFTGFGFLKLLATLTFKTGDERKSFPIDLRRLERFERGFQGIWMNWQFHSIYCSIILFQSTSYFTSLQRQ